MSAAEECCRGVLLWMLWVWTTWGIAKTLCWLNIFDYISIQPSFPARYPDYVTPFQCLEDVFEADWDLIRDYYVCSLQMLSSRVCIEMAFLMVISDLMRNRMAREVFESHVNLCEELIQKHKICTYNKTRRGHNVSVDWYSHIHHCEVVCQFPHDKFNIEYGDGGGTN